MAKGKKKSKKKRLKWEERKAQQAENRRKLIAKLDRKAALMVTQDFAKLGLYQ